MKDHVNTIKLLSISIISLGILVIASTPTANAGGVYQEPADFINEVFDGKPPKADVLWLSKELKQQIVEILDHKYKGLRVRYWQIENRSAWVLEEIGKEKQITAGIVVNTGKIEQVKVLVFRESRGWEVRHDFFTDQFRQASLKQDNRLDKNIDNISGATLSVRAIKKLARIALLLDQQVQNRQTKTSSNDKS
jgi:hypothetical protein